MSFRGAFGSHVACVMKRLLRICIYYGTCPQFIACSATIGNPLSQFLSLVPVSVICEAKGHTLENSVCVIDNSSDGSPSGQRYIYVLSKTQPILT